MSNSLLMLAIQVAGSSTYHWELGCGSVGGLEKYRNQEIGNDMASQAERRRYCTH